MSTEQDAARRERHEIEGYHWIETECCVVCDEPVVEVEGRGWEHANERMSAVIDSLTAERDEARRVAGNLLARIFRDGGHRAATYETLGEAAAVADLEVANLFARAEAAEAEVKRLREALSVVHECAEKRLDDIPPYPKRIDEMNEAEVAIQNVAAHCCGALVFIEQYARAALATPPSEGQS